MKGAVNSDFESDFSSVPESEFDRTEYGETDGDRVFNVPHIGKYEKRLEKSTRKENSNGNDFSFKSALEPCKGVRECSDLNYDKEMEAMQASANKEKTPSVNSKLGLGPRVDQEGGVVGLNEIGPTSTPNEDLNAGLRDIHYSPIGITIEPIRPISTNSMLQSNQQCQARNPFSLPDVRISFEDQNDSTDPQNQRPFGQGGGLDCDHQFRVEEISSAEETQGENRDKKLLYKKARRKRINKMRRKREAKVAETKWASFLKDMIEASSGKARKEERKKKEKDRGICNTQAENHILDEEGLEKGKEVALGPEEIFELGKKLGVIDTGNEASILDKLREMEQCEKKDMGGVDENGCQ